MKGDTDYGEIRIADLVGEIGNIRRPFAQKVSGRRGIEY